jgi:hypothetical protein
MIAHRWRGAAYCKHTERSYYKPVRLHARSSPPWARLTPDPPGSWILAPDSYPYLSMPSRASASAASAVD